MGNCLHREATTETTIAPCQCHDPPPDIVKIEGQPDSEFHSASDTIEHACSSKKGKTGFKA